jgi:hypothetical protein
LCLGNEMITQQSKNELLWDQLLIDQCWNRSTHTAAYPRMFAVGASSVDVATVIAKSLSSTWVSTVWTNEKKKKEKKAEPYEHWP